MGCLRSGGRPAFHGATLHHGACGRLLSYMFFCSIFWFSLRHLQKCPPCATARNVHLARLPEMSTCLFSSFQIAISCSISIRCGRQPHGWTAGTAVDAMVGSAVDAVAEVELVVSTPDLSIIILYMCLLYSLLLIEVKLWTAYN